MADNFKYNDPDSNENGLKEADAEKSENKTSDGQSAQEIFGSKFMSNSLSVNARKDSRKRNFPIIVDIVIGILILAIFAKNVRKMQKSPIFFSKKGCIWINEMV